MMIHLSIIPGTYDVARYLCGASGGAQTIATARLEPTASAPLGWSVDCLARRLPTTRPRVYPKIDAASRMASSRTEAATKAGGKRGAWLAL
eukprot:scaffold4551_cov108-Isochrysis_galbana.AAC.2